MPEDKDFRIPYLISVLFCPHCKKFIDNGVCCSIITGAAYGDYSIPHDTKEWMFVGHMPECTAMERIE